MAYREIRVRPVVRYIVTHYSETDDGTKKCLEFGEFDGLTRASTVAICLAQSDNADHPWRKAPEVPTTLTCCHEMKIVTKHTNERTYYALSFNDAAPAMWAAPLSREIKNNPIDTSAPAPA